METKKRRTIERSEKLARIRKIRKELGVQGLRDCIQTKEKKDDLSKLLSPAGLRLKLPDDPTVNEMKDAALDNILKVHKEFLIGYQQKNNIFPPSPAQ
jgi:hypothetical protein